MWTNTLLSHCRRPCVRSQTRLGSLEQALCSTKSCHCSCRLHWRTRNAICWSKLLTAFFTNSMIWCAHMCTRYVQCEMGAISWDSFFFYVEGTNLLCLFLSPSPDSGGYWAPADWWGLLCQSRRKRDHLKLGKGDYPVLSAYCEPFSPVWPICGQIRASRSREENQHES